MSKDNKALNILFRICIFAAFAMCTVSASRFVYYAIKTGTARSDKSETEYYDSLNNMLSVFRLHDYLFFVVLLCVILSISTRYKATLAAVICRTALLGYSAVMLITSKAMPAAYLKIVDTLEESGADIMRMSDAKALNALIESGLSKSEADQLIATLTDEDSALALVAAYAVTMFIAFILSITSLHNLFKRDLTSAEADLRELEGTGYSGLE